MTIRPAGRRDLGAIEEVVESAIRQGRGYREERRAPKHGATLVFMAKQL